MRSGDQSAPILTASKPWRGERCETHRSPTIDTGPRGDPYFFSILDIRKKHPLFGAVTKKVCSISWQIYELIGDDTYPRKATKEECETANKLTKVKERPVAQAQMMLEQMRTRNLGAESVSLSWSYMIIYNHI